MKKYFVISVSIISLCVGISLAMAQDNEEEDILDGDLEYTYGSVVSVTPAEIVINEYNYESDQEVQVSYVVNGETKFNKINSAQELAKDDNVDVYYKVIGEQKVAQLITKDDTLYETQAEEADGTEIEVNAEGAPNAVTSPANQETQNQINIDSSRG